MSPFNLPVNTQANAPLVSLQAGVGRLHYGRYAEQQRSEMRNLVPDFSYAGYEGGGVALPSRNSIPNRETLEANSGSDDTARIQAAIDAVASLSPDANGIRGAVLLRQGKYTVSETLNIAASGVVIRGESRGENGTVIRSTITGTQDVILEVGGGESSKPNGDADRRQTDITDDYVPVGAVEIGVTSTAGYSAGDRIALVREPNAEWVGINGVNTAQYGWTDADYDIAHERRVVAVEGNRLIIDAPIVDAIEANFGGGYVYRTAVDRSIQIGVEDLRLEGNPDTGTANQTPLNGPYTAIRFGRVENSWVRNVTVRYVSHGVITRSGAHFNTFEDLAYLDPRFGATEGGRRYAFLFEGNSSFNLTQRCYGEQARHTFITGSRVPGPNVFLDCIAENASNDSGPHHRWATGTLYDNTKGHQLRAQNRASSGSGHGWAGAQQMFWNTEHDQYVTQAPPYAMNWSVGSVGSEVPGQWVPGEALGIRESLGEVALPRSLYLQQLHDRLGEAAVVNVTTSEQRAARIWNALAESSGED